MSLIVTLTMNPALDINVAVKPVQTKHKLRGGPAILDPGGAGVNVARVIQQVGGKATPLYAVGGPTGHAYQVLLDAEGISGYPIPIMSATRPGVTVDETSTGDQYRFVVQGPEFSEREWQTRRGSYLAATASPHADEIS